MSNAVAARNNSNSTVIARVVFTGVMAAIICVITIFRIPLIRGVNDTEENLDMTAAFVTDRMKDNENISVELLPYHSFGRDKYRWLDREYAMKEDAGSSEERMEERKRFLRNRGLNVL